MAAGSSVALTDRGVVPSGAVRAGVPVRPVRLAVATGTGMFTDRAGASVRLGSGAVVTGRVTAGLASSVSEMAGVSVSAGTSATVTAGKVVSGSNDVAGVSMTAGRSTDVVGNGVLSSGTAALVTGLALTRFETVGVAVGSAVLSSGVITAALVAGSAVDRPGVAADRVAGSAVESSGEVTARVLAGSTVAAFGMLVGTMVGGGTAERSGVVTASVVAGRVAGTAVVRSRLVPTATVTATVALGKGVVTPSVCELVTGGRTGDSMTITGAAVASTGSTETADVAGATELVGGAAGVAVNTAGNDVVSWTSSEVLGAGVLSTGRVTGNAVVSCPRSAVTSEVAGCAVKMLGKAVVEVGAWGVALHGKQVR